VAELRTVEIPIAGMDCADCVQLVQHAIAKLPGVQSVDVYLIAEKASMSYDPALLDMTAVRKAVEDVGYSVRESESLQATASPTGDLSQRVLRLLFLVAASVLFVVIAGEWLGLFARITERVPWPLGLIVVLAGGFPVFRNVVRAALKGQIIAHTLMTVGVIAALVIGQWVTAAVIVFFMRVGDYVETFTAGRARRAVKDLTDMAPRTARVLRAGDETEMPVESVQVDDIVVVRPGESIPVDGEVVDGQATIDQAAITGEAMPVEAGPGAPVYAATIIRLGSLRVRTTRAGADSTFGRVIKMVEEAEQNRAEIQRVADKFSSWYLPVVVGVALLTLILRRDPMATVAVLVVACSCSVALATPIAMLASIGAAARHGLMVKGGRYLEVLARADTLLIDKTGTLTLGQPQITDIISPPLVLVQGRVGAPAGSELLYLAASAERYSEHPLAEVARAAARARHLSLAEPQHFEAVPGVGVHAEVDGFAVSVGNRRMLDGVGVRSRDGDGTGPTAEPNPAAGDSQTAGLLPVAAQLEAQGKTLLFVALAGELAGLLAATDTLRPEVPEALAAVRALGIRHVELLTGDHAQAARALAEQIGVSYQADLLPEHKIEIVKRYQALGRVVVMVGDGVNDAPALAQADVGIAIGAARSSVAVEAAHIALMLDDWTLVPEVIRIARRTMGVVKMNLAFTALYNVVGLSLAAFGLLPPVWAAAAQSLPDLGILGNSSRLLRHKRK